MSSGFTRRRLLALAGATSLSAALAGAVRAEGGVAAPVTVSATEAPFATTTPVRIGAAALRVRELEPMNAWYRSVLGLDLLGKGPDGVVLGVADVPLLTLIPAPDAMPDSPALAGLFHIAFLMPDRAALARWLVHAAALRVPLQGFADHSVSEAIYLADPEGNGLEVYADRPRQDWRWQDGVVTMGTYSLDIDSLLTLTDPNVDSFRAAPSATRIGHMHLRVGDIPQGRAFYETALGLISTRGDRPDSAFLASGGYHHHVALNIWQSEGAGPRDLTGAGLAWFELAVADPAVLAAITARLPSASMASGRLVAADPWGTEVRIFGV